jgi:hypothetical protein
VIWTCVRIKQPSVQRMSAWLPAQTCFSKLSQGFVTIAPIPGRVQV